MNAIQQKCRPKHQVLVLKCYPRTTKGAVDVKPNSSELSYLLFYATSRRSKIQKIGAFLEKKTASDVWRLRIGNVQVTLQILAALIEKTPKDLPLLASNVLKILDLVLGSKDITMAQSSIATFEAFCANHDVSSSFADHNYLAQYESVVRLYATLASTRHTPGKGAVTKPVQMRWRDVGLEAIRSVSSSDPLASVAGRQFGVIVPIILENLWWEDDEFLDVLLSRVELDEKITSEEPLRRRTSVATARTAETQPDANPRALAGTAMDVDKLDEEDVGVLALQCLKQIFIVPNQPQIHAATLALLKFIQERVVQKETVVKTDPMTGKDTGWAIRMFSMIPQWVPVQDRYIILVTAMDHLLELPVTEENLQQHIVLTAMISSILRSDVNLIGLSVMDVLLGFIQHIRRLMRLPGGVPEPETEKGEERPASAFLLTEDDAAVRRELLSRIQQCIGDLATHVYYADQISDMISAILLRLRPTRPSSTTNSSPRGEKADPSQNDDAASTQTNQESYLSLSVGKTAALQAIKLILRVANPKTRMAGNMNLSRNRVPIKAWEGTHWLLRDPDGQVRKAYADALLTWLDRETTKADLKAVDETRQSRHRSSTKGNNRELQPESNARRAVSSTSHRERAMKHHRSHFLHMLHLAIYENALQFMDFEPDMVLLHALLTKLVSRLGVNAVRYGLPMVFRLQEDIQEADTPLQKVRLGSLCHGYFWAVMEHFDIEASVPGQAIQNEVIRRRSKQFWVDGIHVPPPTLDKIGLPGTTRPHPKMNLEELETEALLPFDDRIVLVESIATSYADSAVSPPVSPAASPGRSFTHPIIGTATSGMPTETEAELPDSYRELMLAEWTRDAAVASLQANSKSESLTGSRTGTTVTGRHRLGINGHGNGQQAASPLGSQQNLRLSSPGQGGAGLGKRQASMRSAESAAASGSSRGPVASVDQLKMVLSGQLPRTAAGTSAGPPAAGSEDEDSGSDSMVSYEYEPSELSFNNAAALQHGEQNTDGTAPQTLQRKLSHGKKGGPLSSNPTHEETPPSPQGEGDGSVPPVPPLPDMMGLIGKSGSLRIGRPTTAPHEQKSMKRAISSRSGDNRYRTPLKDEGAAETMDLRDLLRGIDSGAGEQSLGNVTRPPY